MNQSGTSHGMQGHVRLCLRLGGIEMVMVMGIFPRRGENKTRLVSSSG